MALSDTRPPLVQDAIDDLTRRAYHGADCLAPALERDYFDALLRYIHDLETRLPLPVPATTILHNLIPAGQSQPHPASQYDDRIHQEDIAR